MNCSCGSNKPAKISFRCNKKFYVGATIKLLDLLRDVIGCVREVSSFKITLYEESHKDYVTCNRLQLTSFIFLVSD